MSKEHIRRIGIFCFYNLNGRAGRYIYRLLDVVTGVLDDIVIVSNSDISEKSQLKNYTDKIIKRKNVGFDAGAYKDIILSGLIHLNEIDELLLFNDTFYWINNNIKEVFNTMRQKGYDIWGITQNNDPRVRRHLQSYFMVFTKKVLTSHVFMNFWKCLFTETKNINVIISNFEIGLTSYFESMGFSCGAYITADNNDVYNDCVELVCEKKCPVLKRKALFSAAVSKEELRRLFDYIETKADYSLDFISDDLKNNQGIIDIYTLGRENPKKYLSNITLQQIKTAVKAYSNVKIYGITVCGIELSKAMPDKNIEFVVSDSHYDTQKINGINVISYYGAKEDDDTIMIVTLGYENCQKLKKIIDWKKVIYYW